MRYSTTVAPITEEQVLGAFRAIIRNQEAPALNWAVNYASAGLHHPYKGGAMTGEELYFQVLYTLNNISRWRGEVATETRNILKQYVKENKRRRW